MSQCGSECDIDHAIRQRQPGTIQKRERIECNGTVNLTFTNARDGPRNGHRTAKFLRPGSDIEAWRRCA